MRGKILLLTLSLGISGCTTMSAIETAGEELSEGNVASGLWTGTMGVFLGAITDVFTFGGTLETDDAAEVWGTWINAAAATQQAELPQQKIPSSSLVFPEQQSTPTQIYMNQQPNMNLQPENTSNTKTKTYRAASHCISIDRHSSAMAHHIINNCNFDVYYRYVIPSSQQLCRIGMPCGFNISANRRTSNTNHKENIRYVACESPATPKAPDGSRWTGSSHAYICTN